MTLQLIPSEFPYIWGKISFSFFISGWEGAGNHSTFVEGCWVSEYNQHCLLARAELLMGRVTITRDWSGRWPKSGSFHVFIPPSCFHLGLNFHTLFIHPCISTFSLPIGPALYLKFLYSRKKNCPTTVPVPTVMCLWAIYIFPGSVHIFGCSKIDRLILEIYKKTHRYICVGIGRQNIIILFWK